MIKKLIILCACLCLCLCGCGQQQELPSPTQRFFINDFADVMSDADEQAVYAAGVALQQQTDAQLVLVTVDSLDGYSLEEYALALAQKWALGDSEKDNGLLLLFSTDGPHTRVEVGYGLEGALPDSKVGRILDDVLVPYYDDEDAWSSALVDTYTVYVNEVYAEYGLTESVYPVTDHAEEEGGGPAEILMIMAILLIFALLRGRVFPGMFIASGGFRGGGFHGGGFRGGGGGFRGGGGGFGGGGASR